MIVEKKAKNVNQFNLQISYSADVILDKEWHNDNVKSPFSRLYYVKKGRGYLECKEKRTEIYAGKVYLIPSETMFSYGCYENETIEKLYFHISFINVENKDILSSMNDIFCLDIREVCAESIFSCYGKEDYIDVLRLKPLLYNTVIAFCDKNGVDSISIQAHSDMVSEAIKYIQQNARIDIGVADIAKKLFVSESKLQKEFKKEIGISVGAYIDEIVFSEARKLLASRNAMIKDISKSLGFCDQFYFSRRFKEKVGVTPSQYRKENLT